MFGPRLSRVFASRWAALWWAATMLLLAWQLVPSANDPAEPAAEPSAASGTFAANPWALATTPAEMH
jgi:hypothetical protein